MKVRDAMHKGCEWVTLETLVSAIATKMRQHDIGALPVGENDRLIGMVTDRDLALRAIAAGKDAARLTARDVMTGQIHYCHDDEEVEEAAERMETRKVRRLPVIDAKKRMVGMLSLGDIAQVASPKTAAHVAKAVTAHHA